MSDDPVDLLQSMRQLAHACAEFLLAEIDAANASLDEADVAIEGGVRRSVQRAREAAATAERFLAGIHHDDVRNLVVGELDRLKDRLRGYESSMDDREAS